VRREAAGIMAEVGTASPAGGSARKPSLAKLRGSKSGATGAPGQSGLEDGENSCTLMGVRVLFWARTVMILPFS